MKIFPKNPFLTSTGRARRIGILLSLACAFSAGISNAATYNWNTTSGTWDTTTANWTGGGTTWVDSSTSDPVFANTTTVSTITLNADRTARAITIGNATNNYNYTLTGSSVTLNGASLAFAGSASNNSQDHLASQTVFNGSLNLTLSGNVTIRRGNLEFGGTGTYNVGNITTSGDWGIFRMSGSAIVNTPGLLMGSGGGGAVTGSFDLNGGTLTAGSITAIGTGNSNGNTWSTRNTINGATIKASQNNATFLTVSASSLGVVNGTDSGNNVWLGNSGVTFDSNGFSIGTATVFRDDTSAIGTLTKTGNGILSLSGASLYTGATSVQAGTLRVTGSLAAGSSVSVSGGAALGGTGTINGPVAIASGATTGTQGTIDLVDGEFGTLGLANTAGLTLGGTSGNLSNLKFDVGAVASDLLDLGSNTLTVASGGASITVTSTSVAAGNSYDLISFGSGAGAGFTTGSGTTVGALTLANPNITFGVSGYLNVTADKVQLVTTGASAPSVAYWSGVKGTTWTSNDGTGGNFTTNANGTGFVGAYPSSFTDVIFAANGNGAPTNLSNTLGQNFEINSLTFAGSTAAVTISGANKLTLDSGITLESGNGGASLSMTTLALGNYQTWTNASNHDLTVSAAVTGTSGLSIENTGAGVTILSGINTYSGGTTLINGTLRMSGSGTLGATNGSLSITAGVLDLNGTSQAVGQIDGTDGSIVNNSTDSNSTFSASGGNFAGVIADHTSGTGTIAVTKTGNDVLTLSGANSYSGKTTLNGGTLIIGSGENIPNASVLEINNGAKFNIQGFTESYRIRKAAAPEQARSSSTPPTMTSPSPASSGITTPAPALWHW
jgi:autotransporter-associated beta strand protein